MRRTAAALLMAVATVGAVPKKGYAKPLRSKAPTVDHWPGCRTKACDRRVGARIRARRARAWLWRHYKRNPMPYCTWGPESSWDPATGESFHGRPWARGRYRVKNPSSTAAGKFQILDQTFHAYGGANYPGTHDAAKADPLFQEKVARRILRGQGIHAWVKC